MRRDNIVNPKDNPLNSIYPHRGIGGRHQPAYLNERKISDGLTFIREGAARALTPKTSISPPIRAVVTTIYPPEEMYKAWLLPHLQRSHPRIYNNVFQYLKANENMGAEGFTFQKAIEAGLPKFISGPIRVAIDEINCFLPMQEDFGDEKNMSHRSRVIASMSDTHCLMFPESADTTSPNRPGQIVEISYTHMHGARWSGGLFGNVTQADPLPGFESSPRPRGKEVFVKNIQNVATSLLEPDEIRGHRIKITQGTGKDILEGNI
jgi:hypothetical protein